MCPACLGAALWLGGGIASAGGLAAFAALKLKQPGPPPSPSPSTPPPHD